MSRRNSIPLALALTASAASCVQHFQAPEQIVTSGFEKTVTVGSEAMPLPNEESGMARLVSVVSKDGSPTTHSVYVQIIYSRAWRFYQSANAEGGDALQFVPVKRNVGACTQYGCGYEEQFAATIPDARFVGARQTGLAVKFYAQAATPMIVSVPAAMVARQLELEDSVSRAVGARTRSNP